MKRIWRIWCWIVGHNWKTQINRDTWDNTCRRCGKKWIVDTRFKG